MFLVTNCLTKVAQIFSDVMGDFEKISLFKNLKTVLDTFLKIGLLFIYHLVTLVWIHFCNRNKIANSNCLLRQCKKNRLFWVENHDWTNCCRYNWRKTFYLARLLMLLTTLRLLSLQVVCTMRERIWYNRSAWTYKVIFENKFTLVLNALIGLKMTHQSDCLKSAYHKVTHKIFHLNLMPKTWWAYLQSQEYHMKHG